MIILISILFLQNFTKINYKKLLKFVKIFIIICLFGIFLKQGQRIYKYHEVRTLIPSDRSLLAKDQENIKKIYISKNFYYYETNNQGSSECKYFRSPCTNIALSKLYHKRVAGYDLILKYP